MNGWYAGPGSLGQECVPGIDLHNNLQGRSHRCEDNQWVVGVDSVQKLTQSLISNYLKGFTADNTRNHS